MSGPQSIWDQAKGIVGQATELRAEERASFVEARCGGNAELRREVESLLRASASSDAVLHPETDAWVGATRDAVEVPATGRLGKFDIVRVIADGPNSVVYEAAQRKPERLVALKVVRFLPMLGVDSRFWFEASAAARVEHPNVVRVYEVGFVEPAPGQRLPFIAMELVSGLTLTEYARRHGLGVWDAVRLMKKVAAGVSRIHQCGIIHRDLKPSNVLVDASGEPRVLDFGIAREVGGPEQTLRTMHGAMLGTPGYISPEQALSPADVDVRTDVWALGALLYELLCGQGPFSSEETSALDSIRRVMAGEPEPVRRRARHVPIDLEAVVMKALARQPGDRYESVEAFAADLDNARMGRPVRARRSTVLYRTSRFVGRHVWSVSAIAAASVAAVAVAFAQFEAWRETSLQRSRAGAALGVVREMISSADPNFGYRDAKMRDVLLGMESRLGQSGDPLIEAEVRSLLGSMSFGLGEYERAHDLLRRAIELRSAGGLGESTEAMMDAAALVHALRWLYQTDAATELAQQSLDVAKRKYGARHPTVLALREGMAGCWHDAGRLEEAEREYRDLTAERALIDGVAGRATLGTRSSLASVLLDMGRYEQAEKELREVVSGWESNAGTLEALTARANLAQVVAEQGRLDEAIVLLRAVDERASRALGLAHPTSVAARSNLAELLRRRGEEAEALAMSDELVERCMSLLGLTHEQTLSVATGHVAGLIRAERASEAEELAARLREAAQRGLAEESVWHARLDSSLAAAIGALGRHEECVGLYRAAIARLETSLGERHRQTLVARNNLGVAMIEAGRSAEAAVELESTLRVVQAEGFQEMEGIVWRNAGRAWLEEGRTVVGIEALRAAYEFSMRRQEVANAQTCARLLAEYFDRSGLVDEAAVWRQRAQGF